MSNKEEKNLYIPDWGKYGIIITITWIGFIASLYIFFTVYPDLSPIIIIIFLFAIFLTCYLPKKFLKQVSKTEFLNYYKNAQNSYVETLLIKQGFSIKEVDKILKNRPIGDLLKNRNRAKANNNPLYEVESIEEFLDICNSSNEEKEKIKQYYDKFEKMSFDEKLKSYYGKGANTFSELKIDSSDYHAIDGLFWDIIHHNDEDLKKLISKEIQREEKEKNYDLDYVEVSCISSSNKTIDKDNYKMTIKDNYIYLLDSEYIIEDKLKQPFKDSGEDYYSLYGSGYYSFTKCTKHKIKLDDIIFYTTDGIIENYTITSGGGTSGNINELKARLAQKSDGRLLGKDSPFLSGDMAAMYSMLQDIKVDPITTRVVSDDQRMVILKTKNMDLVFSRIATFPARKDDIYMFLVDKLPDKDLERMNVLKENSKESKSSDSNLDEIKKLKELLDMGAITKEEFEKKKKELLK